MAGVRTRAGRDWQARKMGDPTYTEPPATWIGVSADVTPVNDTDTTLAGEVTTGTLARAQGTFTHATGASTYTVTKLFTSDRAITVAKGGCFTQQTGGVMAFAGLLDDPVPIISGDLFQSTQTFDLGS